MVKLWDEGSAPRLGALVLGVLLGLGVWFFTPRQQVVTISDTKVVTKVETVEKVITKVQTKVVDRVTTVTRPGETITIVEKEAQLSSKESTENKKTEERTDESHISKSTPLPSYSIFGGGSIDIALQPVYLIGADARIGTLPIFLGVFFKTPKPALGLSVRVEL
jgi:hypothetical protein